jgi:hypothetical protein
LTRETSEKILAIAQIRKFAASYRGIRQQFFDDLYILVSEQIPPGDAYEDGVDDLYVAAISALTSEVTPPTKETYKKVAHLLAEATGQENFPPVRIAIYPDDEPDTAQKGDVTGEINLNRAPRPAREWDLESALPPRVRLSKKQQEVVDEFRAEVVREPRPFAQRRQRGD